MESNTFLSASMRKIEIVMIENAVVDAFGGGTLFEKRFEVVRPASDTSKKPQIPRGFSIKCSAVSRRRTRDTRLVEITSTQHARTTELNALSGVVEAPVRGKAFTFHVEMGVFAV